MVFGPSGGPNSIQLDAITAPGRAARNGGGDAAVAVGLRVCEKTRDCPKRHARTGRFIDDLREARGLYPGFFHTPVRERFFDWGRGIVR